MKSFSKGGKKQTKNQDSQIRHREKKKPEGGLGPRKKRKSQRERSATEKDSNSSLGKNPRGEKNEGKRCGLRKQAEPVKKKGRKIDNADKGGKGKTWSSREEGKRTFRFGVEEGREKTCESRQKTSFVKGVSGEAP